MPTTSRKTAIPRPATAMAKPVATPGFEASLSPGSRSSKSASRSDRRRSLPAPALPPPAGSLDIAALPAELPPLSGAARSLYERRRASGVLSPALTFNGARSLRSDRGYDQGRDRSIASTDETFSIHRLRSNSGLALHTNSAALRRYTDYNADGSSRLSPTDERLDADGRFGDELPGLSMVSPGESAGTPTAPALFSWDTVRAVLEDPMARQRLWEYTRAFGGAENLDFIEKVEQYSQALHNVTALMANISTTFTCMTASEPLNLPPHLAKSLNADIKHVSSSILPGLEMLFSDVDAHIKERIVRQIYPGFARRQLAYRMKASLGAASSGAAQTPFQFKGLGQAFCLTDPYRPDNPIVYASDSFARVLGYSRSEDVPRTGRFFRGPEHTDEETFTEELVLNRSYQSSRPFWSLVSVCPLKTASGRVRFLLSGLVDVSDAVKTRDDIVHTLSAVAPAVCSPSPSGSMNSFNSVSRGSERPASAVASAYEVAAQQPPPSRLQPSRPQSSKREKSASKSFFNPFSRRRRTDDSTNALSPFGSSTSSTPAELSPRSPQPPAFVRRPSAVQAPPPQLDDVLLPIYSRFMVLQFVPGSSHGQEATAAPRRGSRYGANPAPAAPSASAVSRLRVAFSSLPMLELLGLGPAAQDAVMYHDVFAVLSELAGSPSITPVFRASVRQRIVTSESASLELSVPASGLPAPGAFSAGLGAGLASPGTIQSGGNGDSGGGSTSRRSSLLLSGRSKQDPHDDGAAVGAWDGKTSDGWWAGTSSRSRRRSGTFERPPTSERRGREPSKMQRLMSHWTPLKDVDGTVAWVMLVISPMVE